ncbi:MAG: DUF815 domain-containing protein [Pseudomonadota bacterium]
MTKRRETLERIAAALERIAPPVERLAPPLASPTNWLNGAAYLWSGDEVQAFQNLDALPLEKLRGVEAQKQAVCENVQRLASGAASHDMLLWGARGMGKSALIRSAVKAVQDQGGALALVQISSGSLSGLHRLIETLGRQSRAALVFIDDLGFGEGDLQSNLALRSLLDGGVLSRPANIRLAVTSNRRAIVHREAATPGELHERDERDNALALADRFGLTLAFHPCDQATYIEIVRAYVEPLGLKIDETEANSWAIARGNRSGRTAYQFACELAGRAGLSL